MITVSHLKKTYQTASGVKVEALKDINLTFPDKGLVFILGKSGSGKSTLLNCLGALDDVSQGEIYINNLCITHLKDYEKADLRNQLIGFVFQDFNIIDAYSVEMNLQFVLELQGHKAEIDKIDKILDTVGLKDHKHHLGSELSGGQKQRLAIARALIKDPEFILADEPTGNLDTKTALQVMDLLKEISQNKCVIVVTHDPEEAKIYGDRLLTIKDGEVISDTSQDKKMVSDQVNKLEKQHLSLISSFKYALRQLRYRYGQNIMTTVILSISLVLLFLLQSYMQFNQNPSVFESSLFNATQLSDIALNLQRYLSLENTQWVNIILILIVVSVTYVTQAASIDERIKEFSIYKAIGARFVDIFKLLFWECSLINIVSILIGILGSWMYIINLNHHFFMDESIFQINLFNVLYMSFLLLIGSALLNISLLYIRFKKFPLMSVLKGD